MGGALVGVEGCAVDETEDLAAARARGGLRLAFVRAHVMDAGDIAVRAGHPAMTI